MKQFFKKVCFLICFCMVLLTSSIFVNDVHAEDQTIYQAVPVNVNNSYSGRLTGEGIDYYKFVLGESGKVTFTVSMDTSYGNLKLYNHEYVELYERDINHDSNRGCLYRKEEWYLKAGTYYMRFKGREGSYSFALQFESAGESFPESQTHPNDILSQAVNINVETKYAGLIGLDDEQDFYMFHMPFSGQLSLSNYSYGGNRLEFDILDIEGNRLKSFFDFFDSNKGYAHAAGSYSLKTGDYYLKVCPWEGKGAIYNFKMNVKPNVCQISRTTRNKSKATVKIEKQQEVTGYILQYSTSSKFTKGQTKTKKSKSPNIKLTGLKKTKVYYVRAKTVKQWNGKIYYSEYGNYSTMYY